MAQVKHLDIKGPDYTPDIISRNIKQLGNGVIEVRRYNDANLKVDGAWVWFIIIMGIYLYDFCTEQWILRQIQWAIDPTEQIRSTFDFYQDPNNWGYTRTGKDFDTFAKGLLEMHSDSFYYGVFFMIFPILLFLWVSCPRWRPLRFDSKRRLMYFLAGDCLFITRYPEWAKGDRESLDAYLDTEMVVHALRRDYEGGLVFNVPHPIDLTQKKYPVDVGIYRPVVPYQNYILRDFIFDYLSSDDGDKEYARYFKKEHRIWRDYFAWFYHFSIFPARGYNEEKTEAKIQEWLKNNPE